MPNITTVKPNSARIIEFEERCEQIITDFKERRVRAENWKEKSKNFFGIPDKRHMNVLKKLAEKPLRETWMRTAKMVLRTVCDHQNRDGSTELPQSLYDDFPQFLEMSRTLLHDGFIRQVEVSEGGFPHRITTKGLALYSVLDNILPDGETDSTATVQDKTLAMPQETYKLLAALVGLTP